MPSRQIKQDHGANEREHNKKKKYQKRGRGRKKNESNGREKKTEMRNTTIRRGIENVGDEHKIRRRRERKKNKRS
jgi:hypothetical protein